MKDKKTVLKGKEWNGYFRRHTVDVGKMGIMELYSGVTHKYQSIYKVGEYYFIFAFKRGYKNISTLKRLISTHL